MVAIVDFNAVFERLKMLQGRTPASTATDREGSFAKLAPYRDGGVFAAKFAGTSAWERHPAGDEIVQVFAGSTTLHLMTDQGKQALALTAGMVAVVPQNTWHQFVAPDGVCVVTTTPQPSEHLRFDVDDPRTVEEDRG